MSHFQEMCLTWQVAQGHSQQQLQYALTDVVKTTQQLPNIPTESTLKHTGTHLCHLCFINNVRSLTFLLKVIHIIEFLKKNGNLSFSQFAKMYLKTREA